MIGWSASSPTLEDNGTAVLCVVSKKAEMKMG